MTDIVIAVENIIGIIIITIAVNGRQRRVMHIDIVVVSGAAVATGDRERSLLLQRTDLQSSAVKRHGRAVITMLPHLLLLLLLFLLVMFTPRRRRLLKMPLWREKSASSAEKERK